MCFGLHVKYRCYSCPIVMKLEFSWQIFEKSSKTKFHENPPSGSRVVPCGRTDMAELIVAFRSFAKSALKKKTSVIHATFCVLWSVQCLLFALADVVAACVRARQQQQQRTRFAAHLKRPTSVLASMYRHEEERWWW